MIDEHAGLQAAPQGAQRDDRRQERGRHQRELDRSLTAFVERARTDRRAGTAPYSPLMPSAMASHSSCSFGRNTVIAMMAITTSTQIVNDSVLGFIS